MPNVGFSQVALPYVAAMVERFGGEVTVPGRRIERGESLTFERVSNGIRFRLLRGGEVIRTVPLAIRLPTGVDVLSSITAPAAPRAPEVEKRIEVEKIRDEEQFAEGNSISRCDECGLRFERTLKNASGKDVCPYCEVRTLESVNKNDEIARLNAALLSAQDQARQEHALAERSQEMVQSKLAVIAGLQSEIRGLRKTPEVVPPTSDATPAPPNRIDRIRQLVRTQRMSISDAIRYADAEEATRRTMRTRVEGEFNTGHLGAAGGPRPSRPIRERLEEVVEFEFGGVVRSHSARAISGPTPLGEEVHNFEIVVPLRSQIDPSVRIRGTDGGARR